MAERSVTGVEYRNIPGFPDYQVSSDGVVISLKSGKQKVLCRRIDKDGYVRVVLYRNSKPVTRGVHQLVLEAFVGPCPLGMQACHFPNIDRTCNQVGNLRWDTVLGNSMDRAVHGTLPIGERNPRANLTEQQVLEIRERHAAGGVTIVEIAKEYDAGETVIAYLLQGKSWSHVSGPLMTPRQKQKLSDDDVRAIRRRYPVEGRAIASEYGISPQTVYGIATGRKRQKVAA